MSERATLRRLETFLYLLAAGLSVGTIAELIAAKHYDSTLQLVPFALCGLGIVSLIVLRIRPDRLAVNVIRALMLVIAGGSLLGVYEHVTGNLHFVHEVRRHADTMTVIKQTLQGANPILAPGVLVIGAGVTIAATYASNALRIEARSFAQAPGNVGFVDGRDRIASNG